MSNQLARALVAVAVVCAAISVDSVRASAQNPTVVTGRVVSDSKAPIVGASVLIEGTTVGTVTNDDGRYTLTVPGSMRGSATLTLRFIGFRMARQLITLGGIPQSIDWTLAAQATQLQGIVVTALNQQREKQTISTSQQEVTGEALTRVAAPNLISALSGKVSGVNITQNGNMGGSSRIVIRGAGSILGENQPLFIIDGLPISNRGFSNASASGGRDYGSAIGDLNADDIASLTVLKGPNAAALYGSRATNGAVVITTKNGRGAPAGTRVSFTSRFTSESPSVLPKYQNQYGQGFGGDFKYVDGAGSGVNDGADESWGPKLDGRLIDQFSGKAQPWIAHPENVSGFLRSANTVSNNLSVTTSGRGMGARLSITKDAVQGLVPNTSLDKLSGSLSASAVVREKLTIGGSLQYVQNNGSQRPENGYTEGNPFMTFTWFGRQVDVASLKNKYFNTDSPYGLANGSLYNWNDNYHRNPWWQFSDNPAADSRERVIAQISANYQFTPWLSGLVRTGGDSYRFNADEHFAPGNIDNADPAYNGGFTGSNTHAKETNFEGLVTAKHTFGWFDMTLNVGGNKRRNDRADDSFATRGILVAGIYNLANAGITPTTTNAEFHSAVNSTYGSAVVTINKLWTIEATGRSDWSSTLPKNNSSYFYPSLSSSIVLTDLIPALTKNNWLTYAKLHSGFAQVGSDAAPYQLQTLYNGQSAKFSGQPLYTLANTSANANLKPERTEAVEGGAEMSFFNDRVTVDATYYNKKTKDQIINLTIAPATGFSQTAINAGQISNKGIEALISITPIQMSNGFRWTTTLNYAKNKSRV
ncbi:MAG: SusC/RagA family TonB-linked outer membrane protein, partial [Gemmatimonadaceae bacterium]